jgi:hypothetical protein
LIYRPRSFYKPWAIFIKTIRRVLFMTEQNTQQTEDLELMDPFYKGLTFRGLTTKDFWQLLKIIKAGGKEAFAALSEAETNEQRAMVVIDIGLDYAEKELAAFLADLAIRGDKPITVEEYNQGPFDLSLTILEKVQDKNDLAGFFKRAANFIKKFGTKN